MTLSRFSASQARFAIGLVAAAAVPGVWQVALASARPRAYVAVPLLVAQTKKSTAKAPSKSTSQSKAQTMAKAPAKAGVARTGAQIWTQMCATCHGAKGEGGKGYRSALAGDQSVQELSKFIAAEMPPDAPKKLPERDAKAVAAYVYETFYSPIAQARNAPARIELSRLTVNQTRNALSDLIANFRNTQAHDERRGLNGKYFKTRGDRDPVVERVDNKIDFRYAALGALPEQDDPYQFKMRWEGSVFAPETGLYEFVLRTEQAGEFYLNDMKTPLVDARIKSGDSNEYRAEIWLQGGRYYPLRLEWFKGVTGVDDLKKLKEKPPQVASVALAWKRPHRVEEIIEGQWLSPQSAPRVFAPDTIFPPDDRSIGYERGTTVSKEWDDATTQAALETAAYVSDNLRELSGVSDDDKDREAKLREFCRRFVTYAFRRPLSDEDAEFFIDRQWKAAPNVEIAIKRVVLLSLKSPRFLYREVAAEKRESASASVSAHATIQTVAVEKNASQVLATSKSNAFDVASRLSFALWDSAPDDILWKAAEKDELKTRAQVLAQAQRMSNDPRARGKMREFLVSWLKVDAYPDLAKSAELYPDFDDQIRTDLRTSLEMQLDSIVWSEASDFRELMLSDKIWLNGRLAKIYGEPLNGNAPFQPVKMDYGRRSGILTHPYVLSSFAYVDGSSPIHRGVLIARNVLGRRLMPPPAAFVPLEAKLHPNMTTRQRVAMQTKPAACANCHNLINPLGFSLEKFDAIGRIRAKENNVNVDASGSYRGRDGKEAKFIGSQDLAKFLANSQEVHAAWVEKLFHHIVKQPVKAYGAQTPALLQKIFRDNNFNMRQQMIESAVLAAMA